jgi:Family of unknown function (DUF5681)
LTDSKFKPGRSGNPGGRPPGTKNKKTLVGAALEARAEDVAKAVVAAAIDGDMQAAKLVLERIKPPLRNEGPRVQFALNTEGTTLSEQARQVLTAMASGDVDIDSGQIFLNCLSTYAGLREHDELANRISNLEESALAAATAGGLLGKVMQQAASQEG